MRGHENVIQMRLRRKAPSIVFVNDYPCKTDWFETGDHATVCTAGDAIQLLDLRFLKGLKVSISSESESRAKALFDASKRFGASTVGVAHIKPEKRIWEQDGYTEVWHG